MCTGSVGRTLQECGIARNNAGCFKCVISGKKLQACQNVVVQCHVKRWLED